MRRVAPVLLLGLLAACAPSAPAQPSQTSSSAPPPAPSTTAAAVAPPVPQPVKDGTCPYLDTASVAQTNGQRVGKVRLSADQPHPACFFYRPDGKVQLSVQVYVGQPDIATALVNKAAPIDTSNPASDPTGWKGGYESTAEGAVYAVAKGGSAVVVKTNQKQSVKARTVAKQAIAALKL